MIDNYCFSKEGIEEFISERSKMYKFLTERISRPLEVVVFYDRTSKASEKYVSNKVKRFSEYGIVAKITDNKEEFLECDSYTMPSFIQEPHSDKSVKPQFNDCEGRDWVSYAEQARGANSIYSTLWPCTARGIYEHLEWTLKKNDVDTKPSVLIAGRSELVGRPLARLLLNNDYTVSVIHSKTSEDQAVNLIDTADVIVSAVGKRGWIEDHGLEHTLDNNTIIYDVGINFDENGKVCGDIMHPTSYTTPVPYGVGRLTVEALCWNIIDWYLKKEH